MWKDIVKIETMNYVTVYGGKKRHVKQLELNYVTSYEVNYKLSQCSADCVTLHDWNCELCHFVL